jgi:hypothetical protein
MAKRRRKPLAAHIEATQATEPTVQSDAVNPVASEPLPVQEPVAQATPDVFDPATAAQQAGKFEQPTPDTDTRVEEALPPVGVVRGSEVQPPDEHREPEAHHADQSQRRTSGPKAIDTITLGDTNDAPKMRLFRNQRFNQMAIAFEVKPDQKYIDLLRDEGYRFRDGGWTKQLGHEEKWKGHADAERLFYHIANSIRADKGLEPVSQVGMGAA